MTTEHSTERAEMSNFGVFEETATLRRVLMWGAPGVECALAQLLPAKISCFHEQFDVSGARKEFAQTLELLKRNSPQTEVILVKDLFAQMIQKEGVKPSSDLPTLLRKLDGQAEKFYKEYKIGNLRKVKKWMHDAVLSDVDKYGAETAVAMNERLANFGGLPLANVLYARDQSNVAGNVWIWSSMRYTIRQPEVALYKEIIHSASIIPSGATEVSVHGDGRFEGGDLIVSSGICYVGVGGRTNMEGVLQIAPSVLSQGLRLIVVHDLKRALNIDDEMDAMHFDTIAMPISRDEMVICPPEIERRTAREIRQIGRDLEVVELGSFADFMMREEIESIEISKKEQENHAPNFVNLRRSVVALTLANAELVRKLREKDLSVIDADLENITKGYGGLHCMMAPILRRD